VSRTIFSGASLILPDRIADGLTLVIQQGRIVDITTGPREAGTNETHVRLSGGFIAPGFIDPHVHGLEGRDVMDGPGSVAAVAATLPRHGVTAFCPTLTASSPEKLDACLAEVTAARTAPKPGAARVLPAHVESNFLDPDFRGAQPVEALCLPADDVGRAALDVLGKHRPDVGIVTLAPELEGGIDLVRRLTGDGFRVSLGHSAATFEEAQQAIAAGASRATHLFNRMRPMSHREPGLAGAVLATDDVVAEIIADGHHVHPAFVRLAVSAKGAQRLMAITDGTAGSGLPYGSRARLGGQAITVTDVARLDDGTMAGSVATMAQVFACLVGPCGISLAEAAKMCATTAARDLGLVGHGVIARGAVADLVVLDPQLRVTETWIGGARAWP
jgi:N-acetylglucosamine-6-phosphate deacetylase